MCIISKQKQAVENKKVYGLTHWGRDNMAAISQTTFSKEIFNENVRISIKISLKFVPKVQMNSIPALVQITAWRRPGIIWTNDGWFNDAYVRHSASMS